MRAILASLLMLASATLACLGVAGAFVDGLATTAGPMRGIAGPLAKDPALAEALAPRLVAAITEQVPGQIALPSAAEPLLERAATAAVEKVAAAPGFEDAWLRSIDLTREDYVAQLGMVQEGTADSAGVVLDLGPIVSLGYEQLREAAGAFGLGALVEGVSSDQTVGVDLGVPAEDDPLQRPIAAAVAQAGQWGWYAAGSAAVCLLALAVAGRRRWLALAFGGAVAGGAGLAAWLWAADLAASGAAAGADPGGDPLARLVRDTLVSGLGTELVPWGAWTAAAGAVVVVVSMVTHALSRRRPTR